MNFLTWTKKWLDDVSESLFFKRNLELTEEKPGSNTFKIFKKTVAVTVAIGFIGFITYVFNFLSTTEDRISENPQIIKLSNPSLPAKIAFQRFDNCKKDDKKCWMNAEYDDSSWLAVKLPRLQLKKQPGYTEGLKNGWLSYRIKIQIPESIRSSEKTIAFTPIWIIHSGFEVFFNGRLAYVGDSDSDVVVIPLSTDELRNSTLSVAIRAKLRSSDRGIDHLKNILIGPKSVLDDLFVDSERMLVTFFLMLFFAKGSILLVFGLFYLYTRSGIGIFSFLVYAFFTTLENVWTPTQIWFKYSTDIGTILVFMTKALAVCAFQRFIFDLFQAKIRRHFLDILMVTTFSIISFFLYDFVYGAHWYPLKYLVWTTNAIFIASVIAAIVLGFLRLRCLKLLAVSNDTRKAVRSTVAFLIFYLVLVSFEEFFTEFKGFDKRHLYDLCFFFYITLSYSRSFGFTEGKVVTLEAQVKEKVRMEHELEEAAEIARAFMPASIPQWSTFDIALFHRSLTESSGDWFAFEESDDGKLKHVILCDIAGHGVQAALIVSTCKTLISYLKSFYRDMINDHNFLLSYVSSLNRILYSNGRGKHMCTFFGVTLETDTNKAYYICAGHPPAMLIKRDQNNKYNVTPLMSHDSVLGIHNEFKGSLQEFSLDQEQELVLYTDGVPVLPNIRLTKQILNSRDGLAFSAYPQKLYDSIWDDVFKKKNKKPDDDVSIIWFKVA